MAQPSPSAILGQQPFPIDPAPAPAQPNPIPTSTPTLLTYLHALLDARQSQNLTLPYLQPFAPLSSRPLPRMNNNGQRGDGGKGKEKVKSDLDVIRELRESVASWRGVLTKENQEGGRLTTALKEVFVLKTFFSGPHSPSHAETNAVGSPTNQPSSLLQPRSFPKPPHPPNLYSSHPTSSPNQPNFSNPLHRLSASRHFWKTLNSDSNRAV